MATIVELTEAGELFRLDAGLGPREFEKRRIFLLPRALVWLENELPQAGSNWNLEETPVQQMDSLAYEFCIGDPLKIGQSLKPLRPVGDGIWELKSADLRLFGWFVQQDCFIICDCDTTLRVKELKLYRGYCQQAARYRNHLGLDEPKFIAGENFDDVVSNCYYP